MNFNKAQKEAIETVYGNVAVIAAAGSGKTTVLTKRIENMVTNHNIPSYSILAITFSKKAKENIQSKLQDLHIIGVNVETFHSLALKIITQKYGINTYKTWTQQWEKEKVIQEVCVLYGLCNKNDVPYNEIFAYIARQKVNMVDSNHLIYWPATDPFNENSMRNIYEYYENYKKQKHYIEFDDFLNMANQILDSDQDIKTFFSNRFKFVLSDEFQDISISQSLLLKKLNTTNTMIVGDPLQAIYSFRGGDNTYILNFDRDYPNAKIINMNTNYRCSGSIVKTANALARHIPDSAHRYYIDTITDNDLSDVPELNIFESEFDEAEWIANEIKELVKKYSYNNIGILARTNSQLSVYESVFHKQHISFNIVNGKSFTELPETKLLLSYLRLSLHENDNESFTYLYNKPNRWLDKKFLAEVRNNSIRRNTSYYNAMMSIDRRNWRFKDGIDEIYEVINYLQNKRFSNIGEMIKYLRYRLDIDTFISKGKIVDDGSYNEQIENMNTFENIAGQYSSLEEFLSYIGEIEKDIELDANAAKVNLSTIHRSKGLEYSVVFLIGCNNNLFPHEKSNNRDDEKRLFYVGITRAKEKLYLSSTITRNHRMCYPSPFIKCLKGTIIQNYADFELPIRK